ncbi:MAG: tetraacyldisaccharide 4'-kinase [Candidatus Eisenbacteria bacterium]|nr:tetraacyldisaccharide 4'-kinase [Candidatus Eisenbacteria bacterium]
MILDDGFQNLRLHRDLDVVNINSTQPFGPGGLIPSGTLREPLENLSRADIFILTKSNIGSKNLAWIRQKIEQIKYAQGRDL